MAKMIFLADLASGETVITGRTMQCECSCGGKNHGKSNFSCVAEAA